MAPTNSANLLRCLLASLPRRSQVAGLKFGLGGYRGALTIIIIINSRAILCREYLRATSKMNRGPLQLDLDFTGPMLIRLNTRVFLARSSVSGLSQ